MKHNFSVGDIVKIHGPSPELEVERFSDDGRQALVRPLAGWGNGTFWTPVAGVTLVRKGGGIGDGSIPRKIETTVGARDVTSVRDGGYKKHVREVET